MKNFATSWLFTRIMSFSNLYFAISRTFLVEVLYLVGTQIPGVQIVYVAPKCMGPRHGNCFISPLLAPRIWKWLLDCLGNFWRPVTMYCSDTGYVSSSLEDNNTWSIEFSLYVNLHTSLPYDPIFCSLCLPKMYRFAVVVRGHLLHCRCWTYSCHSLYRVRCICRLLWRRQWLWWQWLCWWWWW